MHAGGRDVILTGVPRSGTTLVCHLLNTLPDTVALHEPMRVRELAAAGDRRAATQLIAHFFDRTRAALLATGTAPSKHVAGRIPDGHVAARPSENGLRRDKSAHGMVAFDKPLGPDFLLVLKHPSAFTALLPSLRERFPCFAVIRHPLWILGSWNSVDMGFRDGRAPIAEQLDPALARTLGGTEDPLRRQIALLSWFFEQYRRTLTPGEIIRYEDIVASGGGALGAIEPLAARLRRPLETRNREAAYDRGWLRAAAARLAGSDGAYWHFYSRENVAGSLPA